ncbi:hypothetical protein E4U59_005142 [Claviceps monticola]|nr:hypothetical protein E4U59_005142 [Claviceps monticola]
MTVTAVENANWVSELSPAIISARLHDEGRAGASPTKAKKLSLSITLYNECRELVLPLILSTGVPSAQLAHGQDSSLASFAMSLSGEENLGLRSSIGPASANSDPYHLKSSHSSLVVTTTYDCHLYHPSMLFGGMRASGGPFPVSAPPGSDAIGF